jgi:hypothetical protein
MTNVCPAEAVRWPYGHRVVEEHRDAAGRIGFGKRAGPDRRPCLDHWPAPLEAEGPKLGLRTRDRLSPGAPGGFESAMVGTSALLPPAKLHIPAGTAPPPSPSGTSRLGTTRRATAGEDFQLARTGDLTWQPAGLSHGHGHVIDWAYGFYDHQRRHSTIGLIPPVQYEQETARRNRAAA